MRTNKMIAGTSFGLAGLLAALLVVTFFNLTRSPLMFLMCVALPTAAAGISGMWIGKAVLDRERVETGFQAAGRGVLVVLFAYVLFWISFMIVFAATSPPGTIMNNGLGLAAFLAIVTYWTALPLSAIGALVGWLLYKFRESHK